MDLVHVITENHEECLMSVAGWVGDITSPGEHMRLKRAFIDYIANRRYGEIELETCAAESERSDDATERST